MKEYLQVSGYSRKRVLDEKKVIEIKNRIAGGEAKSVLAKEYGICRQTIYSALAA